MQTPRLSSSPLPRIKHDRGALYIPAARRLAALLAVALVFSALLCRADMLRVTLWRVQGMQAPPNSPQTQAPAPAIGALKQLDSDFILLDGARDWEMCKEVAEALKPAAYHVAVCTGFRDASGKPATRQLAILSKQKPYFFWSEPWRETNAGQPSGFAFIAVEARQHQRLGIYCLSLPEPLQEAPATRQVLDNMQTVRRWEANQVQSLILGAGFPATGGSSVAAGTVAAFEEQAFADLCFDLEPLISSPAPPGTGREIGRAGFHSLALLGERSVCGVNPQQTVAGSEALLTADVELDPFRVAAAWSQRAQTLEKRTWLAKSRGPAASNPQPDYEALLRSWWWAPAIVVALLGLLLMGRRRRRHRLALQAGTPRALLTGVEAGWNGVSYSVVLSPESQVGSDAAAAERPADQPFVRGEPMDPRLRAELGGWLKQKVVGTLVADRERLLEAQDSAAMKAKAVDERLARIEEQIENQTQGYQFKIQELTLELTAAKEENRELIRARIAEVKTEMAAVRARMLASAEKAE